MVSLETFQLHPNDRRPVMYLSTVSSSPWDTNADTKFVCFTKLYISTIALPQSIVHVLGELKMAQTDVTRTVGISSFH